MSLSLRGAIFWISGIVAVPWRKIFNSPIFPSGLKKYLMIILLGHFIIPEVAMFLFVTPCFFLKIYFEAPNEM
jgi:hypothetical protein